MGRLQQARKGFNLDNPVQTVGARGRSNIYIMSSVGGQLLSTYGARFYDTINPELRLSGLHGVIHI
ncbi:hypothetical protein LJC39_02345 [Parabacteroides sp. OttesenSCG-928-B22]|nr:hypothetical protein [Parabacteroides sp. OttesenSCG-928-B22]